MNPELVTIINSHADVLTQKLDVNGGILNRLLAKGVITDDHYDDIKAEKTPRRMNEKLLGILKTRDDKYFVIFREEVRKEQKQLAEDCLTLPDDNVGTSVQETTPK